MKQAVHYDSEDIKAILADRHGVDAKNVIRNQYSYTVVLCEKLPDIKPNDTIKGGHSDAI